MSLSFWACRRERRLGAVHFVNREPTEVNLAVAIEAQAGGDDRVVLGAVVNSHCLVSTCRQFAAQRSAGIIRMAETCGEGMPIGSLSQECALVAIDTHLGLEEVMLVGGQREVMRG